jgi:hypothetical protein
MKHRSVRPEPLVRYTSHREAIDAAADRDCDLAQPGEQPAELIELVVRELRHESSGIRF